MFFEDNDFQNKINRIKNLNSSNKVIAKLDQTLFLEHNQQMDNI